MNIPLAEAPFGQTLKLVKVTDLNLAHRLWRLGLFENDEIVRLDREVLLQPVRIGGLKGEAVLGGGMAGKVIVHLEDGRKLPLAEMAPGESGHIEGLTGGTGLIRTLEVLGFNVGDPLLLIRKLPSMEYLVRVDGKERVRLTEGMAAKIRGRMGEQALQFISARMGEPFHVEEIFGGNRSVKLLRGRGIEPGKTLVLEGVLPAQNVRMCLHDPVIISTREGLRLFLEQADGRRIAVRVIESTV